MNPMSKFLAYNNAVPVVLSIVLLSAGAAFASTDVVKGAVFSESEHVVSVDNTYIAQKNLDAFTPSIQITGVTEDAENYYVTYKFTTIDVVDSVWQDVVKDKTMTVAKNALVEHQSLGNYVNVQLKQIIDHEVAYLKEVQGIEKKSITTKVVATAYSGLVGQIMNESTKVDPPYSPPIADINPVQNPVPSPSSGSAAQTSQSPSPADPSPSSSVTANSGSVVASSTASDHIAPTIQILGNNPATVEIHTPYNDLGAVVTDNVNLNLGYQTLVNGISVKSGESVMVDTSAVGSTTIRYTAVDQAGNSSFAERVVNVVNSAAVPPATNTSVAPVSSNTPATTSATIVPPVSDSSSASTNDSAAVVATTTSAATSSQ